MAKRIQETLEERLYLNSLLEDLVRARKAKNWVRFDEIQKSIDAYYEAHNMKRRGGIKRKNSFMSALLEGAAGHIGTKAVDHLHKTMSKNPRKKKEPTIAQLKAELKRLKLKSIKRTALSPYSEAYTGHKPTGNYKPNSEFIGVRVNGSKVQLKLPNRNPQTLRSAKALANRLGFRVNPLKEFEAIVFQPNSDRNMRLTTVANTINEARKKIKAEYRLQTGLKRNAKVSLISIRQMKGRD